VSNITSLSFKFKSRTLRRGLRQLLVAHPNWRPSRTNGGHVKLVGPGGRVIFTASTSSDHRALLNLRAHLRRAEREEAS